LKGCVEHGVDGRNSWFKPVIRRLKTIQRRLKFGLEASCFEKSISELLDISSDQECVMKQ
jgi:hypothetical protein